jgi:hypothetical protein
MAVLLSDGTILPSKVAAERWAEKDNLDRAGRSHETCANNCRRMGLALSSDFADAVHVLGRPRTLLDGGGIPTESAL